MAPKAPLQGSWPQSSDPISPSDVQAPRMRQAEQNWQSERASHIQHTSQTQHTRQAAGAYSASLKPTGYGSHLTRRILGALICVVAAIAVTIASLNTTVGQGIDTLLMEALQSVYQRMPAMKGLITGVVGWPQLLVVLSVILIVGLVRKRWQLLVRVAIVVVGANATTQLLKMLVERPDMGPWPHLPNSLPSGFTTLAMSLVVAGVFVAPRWARLPAAVIGWGWVTLMALDVMGQAWHRPSDVVVAILIVGVWSLVLGPLESRQRHGVVVGISMDVCAWVFLVLALVLLVVSLHGVDVVGVASRNQSGYGYATYLSTQTWRVSVLGIAPLLGVAGVAALVIREVDRLAFMGRSRAHRSSLGSTVASKADKTATLPRTIKKSTRPPSRR